MGQKTQESADGVLALGCDAVGVGVSLAEYIRRVGSK
jgi:hypothetical protein